MLVFLRQYGSGGNTCTFDTSYKFVDGFAGVTVHSGAADALKVTNVNGTHFSEMFNDIQ
jgi:hypothetical protein